MNILFIHRSFPAQFKFMAAALAQNPNNLVLFITASEANHIQGVNKLLYKPQRQIPPDCHPYLREYEEALIHGQAAADLAIAMRNKGIIPDIIYAHSWGSALFMKDIFPDVPLLCYFEWFGNSENSVFDFGDNILDFNKKAAIRSNNCRNLIDLYSCDGGISPTQWQKDQFPKEFHDKIEVIHDGIETEFFKPDKNAKFIIPDKNLELSTKDEVITYATRGMEPLRGFPQFMETVAKLQTKRPNAHFVIAGSNAVYYGPGSDQGTFKEIMLNKLNLDLNRVHFVDILPYPEYLKLLQISSAHVYLTYPYVLSWSILEAMSCECCVIASDTQPVLEVIKDNENGLLVDFFDVDGLVKKIEYALNNKSEIERIKKSARQTILDKYALKDLLPKHLEYMSKYIKK